MRVELVFREDRHLTDLTEDDLVYLQNYREIGLREMTHTIPVRLRAEHKIHRSYAIGNTGMAVVLLTAGSEVARRLRFRKVGNLLRTNQNAVGWRLDLVLEPHVQETDEVFILSGAQYDTSNYPVRKKFNA